MYLSCHIRISEWIYTPYLPECQGIPCSKQARVNIFCIKMQTWMIGMLIKPQSFTLNRHFLFLINLPYFSNFISLFLKYLVKKMEKHIAKTSLCLSFTNFSMQSFPKDYILLGPCLKNTSYIIQFYHVMFQQQRFNYFFK